MKVHACRRKDVKAYQKGWKTIFVFEKDVSQIMITAFEYTSGICMYLAKAAEIVQQKTT
jgi:hypothetical protein